MSALGKQGIQDIAEQNFEKANYAKQSFEKAGVEVLPGTSYNEFVIKLNKPVKEVNEKLLDEGIIGGFDLSEVNDDLGQAMLVAVTELRTKAEIDTFVEKVGEING